MLFQQQIIITYNNKKKEINNKENPLIEGKVFGFTIAKINDDEIINFLIKGGIIMGILPLILAIIFFIQAEIFKTFLKKNKKKSQEFQTSVSFLLPCLRKKSNNYEIFNILNSSIDGENINSAITDVENYFNKTEKEYNIIKKIDEQSVALIIKFILIKNMNLKKNDNTIENFDFKFIYNLLDKINKNSVYVDSFLDKEKLKKNEIYQLLFNILDNLKKIKHIKNYNEKKTIIQKLREIILQTNIETDISSAKERINKLF
jgi:hypothetical protein